MNQQIWNKITSGDAEVILTGSVVAYDEKSLIFHLANEHDPLKVEFAFEIDSEESKPRMKSYQKEAGKHIVITLINFENNLGTGTVTPIELGTISDKKLFVTFRVYGLSGSKNKMMHYTFYKI